MRIGAVFLFIAALTLGAHWAHSGVLWADDTLPLASAMQVWRGQTLYGGVWFDKPPLVSWIYLLWGATDGTPLRVAGAVYALLCSALAFFAARAKWSEREGLAAALFMAFFLTFGLPSAVLPLASDMLLIAPHLGAIACIWSGRPYRAGLCAGVGFLASSKAAVVVAACLLWALPSALPLLAGTLTPIAIAAAWMLLMGSLADGWRQAWQWGGIYAANTFIASPVREALLRTANFAGFHAAIAVASAVFLQKERAERVRWIAWIVLALGGAFLGLRFFPRYYFLLLPPLALGAARGWTSGGRAVRIAVLFLLLIPGIRFGPRYFAMYQDNGETWSDLALDRDSKECARLLKALGLDSPTLFVWGFRPEIFAYSTLPAANRFLESQPLSGVLADRHLSQGGAIAPEFTEPNRRELARSRPTCIVDSLGVLNPNLALGRRADLSDWFAPYVEVARTRYSILYVRK